MIRIMIRFANPSAMSRLRKSLVDLADRRSCRGSGDLARQHGSYESYVGSPASQGDESGGEGSGDGGEGRGVKCRQPPTPQRIKHLIWKIRSRACGENRTPYLHIT